MFASNNMRAGGSAAVGPHLYWRINISANCGDSNYTSIVEVQMRATIGGADQCTGGTATASSESALAYADYAFDNDPGYWWTSTTPVAWLQYQFASPVSVVEYTIQGRSSFQERNPGAWTLEWSDNGTTWTVADTAAAEGSSVLYWEASEVRTYVVGQQRWRYVKLDVTANGGDTNYLGLAQMGLTVIGSETNILPDQLLASNQSDYFNSDAAYNGAKAFDANGATYWITNPTVLTGWITATLKKPAPLKGYSLMNPNDQPSWAPKTWTVQVSNDGTNWTTKSTQTDFTLWPLSGQQSWSFNF